MIESDHLFGVEFYLKRDSSTRYCEIVAKQPEELSNVLKNVYDDFLYINEIDDQGECDENGELEEVVDKEQKDKLFEELKRRENDGQGA